MPTKVRSNYIAEVQRLIRDGAGILANDYDALIDRALEVYKRKRPLDIVIELTSDSSDFAVSALAGFDEEISGDPMIEWPVTTSGEPEFLDRRDWQFYRKPAPDGLVIRVSAGIGSGEKVRFHFKGGHTIDADGSTIPASDFFTFCKLAAAEGCDDLARHFTQTGEQAMFSAMSGSYYQSKAKEYEQRGASLRKQANEALGAGANESGPPAASVTRNWDTANSRGGDRLTHSRRFR
ncbi:MAG TPA: hypothetical protein VJ464_15860 [Blastocatellia bacterium]|nr:hypothetical protein [Blastocatellia bacterium]